MNNREEMIKALGESFGNEAVTEESHIKTESVSIDNHIYARAVVDKMTAAKKAYVDYPESGVVRSLAASLRSTMDRTATDSAGMLEDKFLKYASAGDADSVSRVIRTAQDIAVRLSGIDADSPQRAVLYLYIAEEVGRL